MPCCLVQCLAQRHARICLSGIQCPIQPGKAATTLALSLCWVQFCSFCPITSLHSPPSVSALRSPLSASAVSLQATEPPNRRTTSFPRILCIVSRQSPVPLPPAPRLANVPLCRRAEPFHAGTRVLRFFLLFFSFSFSLFAASPPRGIDHGPSDLRPLPVAQSLLEATTTLFDSLSRTRRTRLHFRQQEEIKATNFRQ